MESGNKAIDPLRHHTDYGNGLLIARHFASFFGYNPPCPSQGIL